MTTNDFNEEPGSIWQIFYTLRIPVNPDPKKEQAFLDSQSHEQMSAFNPPPGLTPEDYSQLFLNHFLKSREKTREIIDSNNFRVIRYSTLVQVGNPECYRDLEGIEQTPGFYAWENPVMVDFFRTTEKR
jgi:hypothetical protein